MRTKAILLVVAALVMAACSNTKEDKVTKAFMEYVRTDFDDPDDFIEITQVEPTDTIDMRNINSLTGSVDSMEWAFSKHMWERYQYRRRQVENDSISIMSTPIKVRVKDKQNGMMVKKYWVIEQNGEIKVQDHSLMLNEMPSSYVEMMKMIEEMFDYLINLQEKYKKHVKYFGD